MRILTLGTTILGLSLATTLRADTEEGFVNLFDGKSLKGWKSAKSEGPGDLGPFKICSEDKAIHVYRGDAANSVQPEDCLNTEAQFSHFILRLEYKWLEKRFAPRETHDRDAGLLFHVHGDLTRVWPWCFEMQIGETPGEEFSTPGGRFHTGDLFVLGGHLRCKTKRMEGQGHYDPKGEIVPTMNCPTLLGVEKPMGEWNEMEIEVHGAEKAIFKFNGKVVHEIFDLEQNVDGKWVPIEKGHIGLQAEYAEIKYRNIRIKEIEPKK